MSPEPIRHRRGRRTDFVAIIEILAVSGIPVPPPDRRTLRRFRRIIADLETDLYVVLVGTRLGGLVHVTYARHITLGTQGRIEALVVSPDLRRRGIGSSLATLALRRAKRRGCYELCCRVEAPLLAARQFLARQGWQPAGEEFRIGFAEQAGPSAAVL